MTAARPAIAEPTELREQIATELARHSSKMDYRWDDEEHVRLGCICNDQNTVTLDGVHGRRCAQHPPQYSPRHRRKLLAAGQLHTADAYLETWLWIEAGPEPEQVVAA